MTEALVKTGGWTPFKLMTDPARKVFKEAVHLLGVNYEPLIFSTQVVAGTNWLFIANATPVYPHAETQLVEVRVFQPLPGQGEPHVVSIKPLPL